MKKGDKVLSWENLDGPKGIGRGMALCEVVLVGKAKGCIQPFIKVRIRDPRGALWWTPPSSLKPSKFLQRDGGQKPE